MYREGWRVALVRNRAIEVAVPSNCWLLSYLQGLKVVDHVEVLNNLKPLVGTSTDHSTCTNDGVK